jgi:polysaccharide pyruvyl transferase WcaK-like protein
VKKGLLHGYYGFRNLGDDIFLYIFTKKLLKEIAPNHHFIIPTRSGVTDCSDICLERENYRIDILKYKTKLDTISSKMKYVKHLIFSDLLLFGGGTIFYHHNDNDLKNLKVLNHFITISKSTRGKIVGLGIGIDEINNVTSRKIVKSILGKFDLLVLRDKNSLLNYEKIVGSNVDSNKVFIIPDLAYGLGDLKGTIKKEEELPHSIGLNFTIPLGLNKFEQENYVNQMKKVVEFAEKNFKEVYYIIAQPDSGSAEKNLLMKILNYKENINTIQYDGDIEDFINNLAKIETIIASKFHVAVLGHILNKKLYAIKYQDKVKYYMNSINLANNIYNYSQVEDLFKKILEEYYIYNLTSSIDQIKMLKKGLEEISENYEF